jgi:recombinational DNA repair protein (RecF pathway)
LPEVFDLMLGLLRHLPAQPPQPQTVLAFELKLLAQLGLAPDFARTRLQPATRQLVDALKESPWPIITQLKPTAEQVKEVSQFLHGFLEYHIGKTIKGRAEALGV